MDNLSTEGHDIVFRMVQQLVGVKYCYHELVVGCYHGLIKNYGMSEAPEGKDKIVEMVINIMRSI